MLEISVEEISVGELLEVSIGVLARLTEEETRLILFNLSFRIALVFTKLKYSK